MSASKSSTVLRRLIRERTGVIVKPGAYDAMSAQMIERAGFSCLGLSGFGVSVSKLGKPDIGLLTLHDLVGVCNDVTSAVSIPVIADADTGFGNAINAMRTVEAFIKAGAAAIHIEDQVSPKRCGHIAGKTIVSKEEAVGKFRAAARVRDELDPDFVLIARTDARGVTGGSLAEVIDRAVAYAEAGADMIFPEGLLTQEEVVEVCEKVPVPIHYNRIGVSPMLSKAELEQCGVCMVSNATGTLRAAVIAVWDYIHSFKDDDVEFVKEFLARAKPHPAGNLHEFVNFTKYKAYEEEFLPAEDGLRYTGSIGFQP